METQTYHAKLVASNKDGMGYTNYVFEDLEFQNYDYKYVMCVRFPNWEQSPIYINDVGYVTVRFVQEGVDKWYDGKDFNTYKYTNVVFMKFIPEKPVLETAEIILD
mgnify:CR=1 FL=1